ncbi:MAG: patatin-like phospholipase family protein, partial [Alphaproteobacteria bacterium]|nr:patatin-like phospholipase family protein [Alphaproteobacteria bacterium]
GAYQAGVYQALDEAGYRLDWLSGVSIGAVNAAIIAGNAPAHRLERLEEFWALVSSNSGWIEPPIPEPMREAFAEFSSTLTTLVGRPGFFEPRVPPPWLWPPKFAMVTSYYDTTPLHETLERLIDFDRLNDDDVRFSVGAVEVATGNYTFFCNYPTTRADTRQVRMGPEHIMASGALPPGFPPVEIDGAWYWDGGIVSNTPLNHLLDETPRVGTLAFQVDLFSARGPLPATLADVMERQKDIAYSSRTRMLTDRAAQLHELRGAVADVLGMLPAAVNGHKSVARLRRFTATCVYDIVHLIYRSKYDETSSKDYEFSRASMQDRWIAGHEDMRAALARPQWLAKPRRGDMVRIFDPLKPGSR